MRCPARGWRENARLRVRAAAVAAPARATLVFPLVTIPKRRFSADSLEASMRDLDLSSPATPHSDSAPAMPLAAAPGAAREAVRALRASQIREVANAGFGVADVLPFWFGESDRVTPAFIRAAAAEALTRGDTFYTHNLGIAPLREALSRYVSELHGATPEDNIAVTSAGVNALMLAAQLVVGAGDRAVAVTPLWPNLVEIPKVLGATVETVSLGYGARGWTLDLERLLAALTPDTKLLMINSPNNPTGWVMTRVERLARYLASR
jgi:aspartate/methionine/tyrosine aminotransferase